MQLFTIIQPDHARGMAVDALNSFSWHEIMIAEHWLASLPDDEVELVAIGVQEQVAKRHNNCQQYQITNRIAERFFNIVNN
jgi:hypothetical protein